MLSPADVPQLFRKASPDKPGPSGRSKEMTTRMNRIARFPVFAAAASLSLLPLMTGCKKLEARDQLNKGVQAYTAAKYEDAINHFKRAVQLDPTYPSAQLDRK